MSSVGGFLITSALAGLGYMINDEKNQRPSNLKSRDPHLSEPNGENIYHSQDFYKVTGKEADKVIDNWEKSKRPITSNVIPRYFNTLNAQEDLSNIKNPNYDPNLVYQVLQDIDPEGRQILEQHQEADKTKAGDIQPDFAQNPDKQYKHDWSIVSGDDGATLQEINPTLDQTGGSLVPNRGVESGEGHNNMVPFYSGTVTTNTSDYNRMKEGKLEKYTGNFKLNQDQKKETEPLFGPEWGKTNIYGNVEKRDLSRYIPSNTGKKHGEKPFEEVKVGPGLAGQGYQATPKGGFHDYTRVMPKDITQLRVDPVLEQKGKVKPGKRRVDKRTLTGQLYKHKPEVLVDNKDGKRNFTTTGSVKGRTKRPTMVLKDTNRKKSKKIIGPAKSTTRTKNRVAPKTQVSKKTSFWNTPYRNAVQSSGKKAGDYGKSGYKNRPNERSVTGTRSHVLNPKTWVNYITQYFGDSAKKTRKQQYIEHQRPSGNYSGNEVKKHQAFNPREWATRTTTKETTEDLNRTGNVVSDKKQGRAYNPREPAKSTIKETTIENNHAGNLVSDKKEGRAYNPREPAKTTIRETTEDFNHFGNLGADRREGKSYNPRDPAKTTIKETTEEFNHFGNLGADKREGKSYNPRDPAKTTIRETTEDFNYFGNMGADKREGKSYNPRDPAKTTIRETTEDFNHFGNLGADKREGKSYNPRDPAKTTIRETTEDHNHFGNLKSDKREGKSYNPRDPAKTTIRETTEDFNHFGNVKSDKRQGQSYNPREPARTTIRETTEDFNHFGNVKSDKKQGKAYNPRDPAKTTIRETTEDLNRHGNVKGDKKQGKSYNPRDPAKTTIRETTENNKRKGNISRNQAQKGDGYRVRGVEAQNTNRQFTSDTAYTGTANSHSKKTKDYDSAYQAEVNTEKEKIAQGRYPTPVSVNLPAGEDHVNIEVKKIESDRFNQRSATKTSSKGNTHNPQAHDISKLTSVRNQLPVREQRLDPTLLDAYRQNPLTQPLNSYA